MRLIGCVGREENVINVTGFGVLDTSGGRLWMHGWYYGVESKATLMQEVGEYVVLIGG